MLDEHEIDIEIARLEYMESSYPNYAKLANLYTIKNQMHKGEFADYDSGYSQASEAAVRELRTVEASGDSEFLQAVNGKDSAAAWAIMDELMDTLAVVNERVYRRIMQKIREI